MHVDLRSFVKSVDGFPENALFFIVCGNGLESCGILQYYFLNSTFFKLVKLLRYI